MTTHKKISAVETRQKLIQKNQKLKNNDFTLLFNREEVIYKKNRYKYSQRNMGEIKAFVIPNLQ